MKNYFRSLKRCKNKGSVYHPQKTFQNEATPQYETSNKEKCPERQAFNIAKEFSNKNNEYGKCKPKSIESVKGIKKITTSKLEVNKNELSGPQLPSTSTLDTYKSEQHPNRQTDNAKLDSEDKNRTSKDQYNSAAFWKEPLPQVDIDMISDNSCEDEKIDLEDDQTAGQYPDKSQGQFIAATFWKEPIPEVNLGDLLEIKTDEVTELKEKERRDEDTQAKFKQNRDIAEKQPKTMDINDTDKFTGKMNMLEQQNEDLKNSLNDVTEMIKKLENRIKALEENDVGKESVTSMIVSNVECKIPTRY